MIAAVLIALGIAIVVADELDKRRRTRRFGVGLRRSHLHGDVHRPWRWMLHPLYTPDEIDAVISPRLAGARTSGRARTYLGALWAGCRARNELELDIAGEREQFLADLVDPTSCVHPVSDGNQELV